jgi:Mn-containing catalase
MSTGAGDARGPWNNEPTFEFREAEPAVDGGDGLATVGIDASDLELVNRAAMRLQSDPKSDPVTGAMLGMDDGTQGPPGNGHKVPVNGPKAAKIEAKSHKSPPSGGHS